MLVGGRQKAHLTFPDKTELVEEYDPSTFELLTRRWKLHKDFGKEEWITEIGDPASTFHPESDLLAPSSETVLIVFIYI